MAAEKKRAKAKAKAKVKKASASKSGTQHKGRATAATVKKTSTKSKAVAKTGARAKRKAGKAVARTTKPRGSAGRPPRISREMILEQSMEILEQVPVEQFTMARVAASLDTVSMALYNYFPSREALLAEIADHVCMQFEMPPPEKNQRWQDTLLQWLWALNDHAARYPIILKVMGVDGRSSPGWLRITLTVPRTLYELGLRGHDLGLHTWMFCSYAVGMIFNEQQGSIFRSPISLADLDKLDPEEQDFMLMLRGHDGELTSREILDVAFHQMIANIERVVDELNQT